LDISECEETYHKMFWDRNWYINSNVNPEGHILFSISFPDYQLPYITVVILHKINISWQLQVQGVQPLKEMHGLI
jgi:hypothetical protein